METVVAHLVQQCPTCGTELSRVKYAEIQSKLRLEREVERKQALVEAQREAQKVVVEEKKRLADAQVIADALKRKNEEQREALEKASEALEKERTERKALERKGKELVDQAVAKALVQKGIEYAGKLAAETTKVREVLKADHDKEMLKKVAESNRQSETLLKKVKELERKLEAKTANELGDGAEIDVFEELKTAFESRGDRIRRVPKGQPGPDIIHDVVSKAEVCGKIVYDSKNRQGWQNGYTTKLREDMLAAHADYAILPSIVFPQEQRELCIQDQVIIVNPARVVELVRILRKALIRFHHLRVSNDRRAEKITELYEYINSEQFWQKFEETNKLANDLVDIDAKEHDAHTKVWEKRHHVVKKIQSTLGDIDDDISRIVHSNSGE